MTKYPHVQSAFINSIREEGTVQEACDFLQEEWNRGCALTGRVAELEAELAAIRAELSPPPEWPLHLAARAAKTAADHCAAQIAKPPTPNPDHAAAVAGFTDDYAHMHHPADQIAFGGHLQTGTVDGGTYG
jgi:hypothetical protein